MMNELFEELPKSKSPRLLWMERHRVSVNDYNTNDEKRFEATAKGRCFYGATEDEALALIAMHNGWKLWNEEQC